MCICFACNWAYEMLKWLCATQSLVIVAVSSSIHSSFPVEYFSGLSLRFQVAGYLLLVAGEVASSHGAPLPPPLPEDVFEVQLLPFSKRHYRPKKAIFIKSTAIISGFMMITSLLKKTTTFWDTKIISFYCKWINMRCKINCKSSFSYT